MRAPTPRTVAALLLAAALAPPSGRAQGQDAGATGSACARHETCFGREAPAARHLDRRIAPPPGFARRPLEDPFAAFLRHLPVKDGRPTVRLFDGSTKRRTDVAAAVIDLDVGRADLQQCADTILRLRAEWLWSRGATDALAFRFTSGDLCRFSDWKAGLRPRVRGSKVTFEKVAPPGDGRASFRAWLDAVFTYAGTISLRRDLKVPPEGSCIEPGDVFVVAGSPGHAMIVVDVVDAVGGASPGRGRRMFLLAQGFMPAQEAHVVVHPATAPDPWYPEDFGETLVTPEWTFSASDRRRF